MQMECCCTAPCTYCLIYRTLKEAQASLGPPPPHGVPPPVQLSTYCTGVPGEWSGTYRCHEDCKGCMMFTCSPCTCGFLGCLAHKWMGEWIGTEEAIAHTNWKAQLYSCCTWNPIGFVLGCFLCPNLYLFNYDHGLLTMTKEKLGYTTWPVPAGLPRSHGMQMTNPMTAPCTHCLLYRELKNQATKVQVKLDDPKTMTEKTPADDAAPPAPAAPAPAAPAPASAALPVPAPPAPGQQTA